MITEEGFRTILLEYNIPGRVIKELWKERPHNNVTEKESRDVAQAAASGVSDLIEALLDIQERAQDAT